MCFLLNPDLEEFRLVGLAQYFYIISLDASQFGWVDDLSTSRHAVLMGLERPDAEALAGVDETVQELDAEKTDWTMGEQVISEPVEGVVLNLDDMAPRQFEALCETFHVEPVEIDGAVCQVLRTAHVALRTQN